MAKNKVEYDEKALYNAFNKLVKQHIKELQSEIKEYLNTVDKEVRKGFFTDYKNNNNDWYNGYTMYNDSIGIMVYFKDDNQSDKYIGDVQNHIESIIKKKNLPFKFTVKIHPHPESPIEICIKISDLEKLNPNIDFIKHNKYDNKKIIKFISDMINKKSVDIQKDIQSILDKYNANYCSFEQFNTVRFIVDLDQIRVTIVRINNYARVDRFNKKILLEIKRLMTKYINCKFELYQDTFIEIGINLDDVDNIKTIFESVRFI